MNEGWYFVLGVGLTICGFGLWLHNSVLLAVAGVIGVLLVIGLG